MASPLTLDDLDLRILQQLQNDSSLTNKGLAAKTHASPPTCLRRVRRLMDAGVIQKQVAILEPRALGHGLTAIIEITLDRQTAQHIERFETTAASEAAIMQCYRVSSGPDFIVVAQVADMPAYHELAHRVFASDSNIRNVRSFFSVHRSKFDTRVVLPPRKSVRN